MSDLFLLDGAEFSACKKYRYKLWRTWNMDLPSVMFIGLNPSKADESNNDNTIRQVINIARNLGYGKIYMMNLFAYISTNPDVLAKIEIDPVGPDNDKWLQEVGKEVKDIIFAWGAFEVYGRDFCVETMFPNAKALILNKDGSPRHPLYVPQTVKPVIYAAREANART